MMLKPLLLLLSLLGLTGGGCTPKPQGPCEIPDSGFRPHVIYYRGGLSGSSCQEYHRNTCQCNGIAEDLETYGTRDRFGIYPARVRFTDNNEIVTK